MYKGIIKYGLALLIAYNLGSCYGRYKALEEHGIKKQYYNQGLEKVVKNEYLRQATKKT